MEGVYFVVISTWGQGTRAVSAQGSDAQWAGCVVAQRTQGAGHLAFCFCREACGRLTYIKVHPWLGLGFMA